MGGFYGQFLDTVGIEYETTMFTAEYAKDTIMRKWIEAMGQENVQRFCLTNDASIQFKAEWIKIGSKNILVSQHSSAAKYLSGIGRGNERIMGFELFTHPMNIPKLASVIYPLFYTLQGVGDYASKRASDHFHIGFANNLRLLKNLLRICLNLDPVLYRLGGMGRDFRGNINLAAYARPLMNSVAVAVSPVRKNPPVGIFSFSSSSSSPKKKAKESVYEGKYAQIINPLAALEANTIDEFWACFGVSYPVGGSVKYHPSRYSGCNFFAIASHGTMEFRHFNQSLDAYLVMAIAKFLRATVELSTVLNKQEIFQFEPINSNEEISVSDSAEIIHRIVALSHEKEIEHLPSEKELETILETIEQSHFQPLPDNPVLSHIREYYIDSSTAIAGKLNPVKAPLMAQHTDIHNISEKIISIFD